MHWGSGADFMATWQEDGGGLLTVDGAEVRFTGVSAGSKGNAMLCSGGGASGYWEFVVRGCSGAWVGVSTASRFAAGWGAKGLFFGGPGNLSDGGGLVTGSWGPSFGDGDVVGMRVEQTAERVVIAYSKNGVGLGTAFDIAGGAGAEVLRPAVSLSEAGQAVSVRAGPVPPLAALLRAPPAGAGVEGQWTAARGYSLNVARTGDGAWALSAKVGNSLGCRVATGAGGALHTVGGVRSTMMMPPPHAYALEQDVSRVLADVTALRRDGASLVVEGAGKVERFERSAGPGPATRDQIHWLNA